jgi:Spy/CpxP family protein refolding chaperone
MLRPDALEVPMHAHPLRFAALAGLLLAFGASLHAQGCWGPGFGPGRGEGRALMGLKLTEVQQTKVRTIHDHHAAAIEAKLAAAQTAHKVLREAMQNPATEAKTLQALHEKASAAQFDLMLERRAVHQEILPLLTPEQRAQFEKRVKAMGPRGERGRGFGPHPGMNPDCPMVKPS